ncbi:MAG: type II secretion system protein [Planctomycetaceae bacterium]|nr:type II secretion system protein [Planctomycetaceae bacterium]
MVPITFRRDEPRSSVFRCSGGSRAGFSLLELLMVTAILAMISALAAPQLMSMMRESAVFEAADRVREAMGDARRYAIDTGIDYEFRYEINGSSIVVLPTESELNLDESGTASTTTERYIRLSLELPESLRLHGTSAEETSERLDPAVFGDLPGGQLAQKNWSSPIVFRFDGTSSGAEVRVSDATGLTSSVTLRSLTGSARVSLVFQEEL